MAEYSVREQRLPSSESGGPHERFAAIIRAERAEILSSYLKSLEQAHSPVVAGRHVCDQTMTQASEIIADVAASMRGGGGQGGGIPAGDRREMPTRITGQAQAGGQLNPADSLRAAAVLFDVTVNMLAVHVKDDPDLLPCLITAVIALNEGISKRIREATLAYNGYLLERVDQAHIDERHRIARDLHDRLGEGMSVALRQLELHELTSGDSPLTPSPRATLAKEALVEAMHRLRAVTSGLRQDSVRSLEEALVQYIDSVPASAAVRLRVSGDETWATPAIIDEAFLIIREAIRNALRHAAAQTVLIGVALAPHELHAWIEDDGCGFARASDADPAVSGNGISSMRERAALIGGQLTIGSIPGQGTHVELLVPLPGHRDG
jgi:signal transduction histidine kinase